MAANYSPDGGNGDSQGGIARAHNQRGDSGEGGSRGARGSRGGRGRGATRGSPRSGRGGYGAPHRGRGGYGSPRSGRTYGANQHVQPASGRKPCTNFQQGTCHYGGRCHFSHDNTTATAGGGHDASYGASKPCFSFQRGACTFGDECKYSHDLDALARGGSRGGGFGSFRGGGGADAGHAQQHRYLEQLRTSILRKCVHSRGKLAMQLERLIREELADEDGGDDDDDDNVDDSVDSIDDGDISDGDAGTTGSSAAVPCHTLVELRRQEDELSACMVEVLAQVSTASSQGELRSAERRMRREVKRFSARLPILARRSEIIDTVKQHRVVVVRAETGSGKSTQLPAYLADAGLVSPQQRIACTQPRKLAASSLADRVASEWGCGIGREIVARLNNRRLPADVTLIEFMTDNRLLMMSATNPRLDGYGVVCVDEAHERNVDTDLLFGQLTLIMRRRPDLRVVVMSATLDQKLFASYFEEFDPAFIDISGRTFPIDYFYEDDDPEDFVTAAVKKAFSIVSAEDDDGHLLVFVAAASDVEKGVRFMKRMCTSVSRPIDVLPLHGMSTDEERKAAFAETEVRKVIFSTNVAETSVTIPGVTVVIDSGMEKRVSFDVSEQLTRLDLVPISRNSAKQRAGRAGRTAHGRCYRMYSLETYEAMDESAEAEILCMPMTHAVLKLKALGVGDVIAFPWLEQPEMAALTGAVSTLKHLQALEEEGGELTQTGRCMVEMPVQPELAAMVLSGASWGVGEEVMALAAMMCVGSSIFWLPKTEPEATAALADRMQLLQGVSDHLALLRVWEEWRRACNEAVGSSYRQMKAGKAWANEHYIIPKSLARASQVFSEIRSAVSRLARSQLFNVGDPGVSTPEERDGLVMKSLIVGFARNIAVRNGPASAGYFVLQSKVTSRVDRKSLVALAHARPPDWIIYHSIFCVKDRSFLQICSEISLDVARSVYPGYCEELENVKRATTMDSRQLDNLGPAAIRTLLNPRGRDGVAKLERQLRCIIELSIAESRMTVWARDDALALAVDHVERLVSRAQTLVANEVREVVVAGGTRALVGPGGDVSELLFGDDYTLVVIGGLPPEVDEDTVVTMCKKFGDVSSVRLTRRKKGTGEENALEATSSATVRFMASASATRLVRELSGTIVESRELRCQPARQQEGDAHIGKQACRVEAYWYLAPSTRKARVLLKTMSSATCVVRLLRNATPTGTNEPLFVDYKPQLGGDPAAQVFLSWNLTASKCQARAIFDTHEHAAGCVATCEGQALRDVPISCRVDRFDDNVVFFDNLAADVSEDILREAVGHAEGCRRVQLLREKSYAAPDVEVLKDAVLATLSSLSCNYVVKETMIVTVNKKATSASATVDIGMVDDAKRLLMLSRPPYLRDCPALPSTGDRSTERLRIKQNRTRQTHDTRGDQRRRNDDHVVFVDKLPADWDRFSLREFLYERANALGGEAAADARAELSGIQGIFVQYQRFQHETALSDEERHEQRDTALVTLRSLFSGAPEIQVLPPNRNGVVNATVFVTDAAQAIADVAAHSDARMFGSRLRLVCDVKYSIFVRKEVYFSISSAIDNAIKVASRVPGVRVSMRNVPKGTSARRQRGQNDGGIAIYIDGTSAEGIARAKIVVTRVLVPARVRLTDDATAALLFNRPPATTADNVCYAFRKGECEKGDSCRFAHVAGRDTRRACFAFKDGKCTRGDSCRFSHMADGAGGAAAPEVYERRPLELVKRIAAEYHTYVRYERDTMEIKVYGDTVAVGNTLRAIREVEVPANAESLTMNTSSCIVLRPGSVKAALAGIRSFASDHPEVNIQVRWDTQRLLLKCNDGEKLKLATAAATAWVAALPAGNEGAAAAAASASALGDCRVCFLEVEADDAYVFQACGHALCKSTCAPLLVDSQQMSDTVKCLECCKPLALSDVIALSKRFAVAVKSKVGQLVTSAPDRYSFCFGTDCSNVLQNTGDPRVECDECEAATCVVCKAPWHAARTCEEFQRIRDMTEDELFDHETRGLNVKKCPNSACRAPNMKVGGCNACLCSSPTCRQAFCWLCLSMFDGDAHPHFRDTSTPCFEKLFEGLGGPYE